MFFVKKVNLSVNNKFLLLEPVSAMCLNIIDTPSSNNCFCKKVNLSVNNKFLLLELVSAMCLNIVVQERGHSRTDGNCGMWGKFADPLSLA
jgi:hypothetical protein